MNKTKPYSIWKDGWRGQRGEVYVAIQGLLFTWIIFGPKNWSKFGPWPLPEAIFVTWTGIALIVLGCLVALSAAVGLGRALTPLPKPNDAGTLIATGVYRWMRHPIYTGVMLMTIGWALYVEGIVTLVSSLVLGIFFYIKSRREEQWLLVRYPEYKAYQKRTFRFIPFIF